MTVKENASRKSFRHALGYITSNCFPMIFVINKKQFFSLQLSRCFANTQGWLTRLLPWPFTNPV